MPGFDTKFNLAVDTPIIKRENMCCHILLNNSETGKSSYSSIYCDAYSTA